MTEAAQITKQGSYDLLETAEATKTALEKLGLLLNEILDETGTEPRDELNRACYTQHRNALNLKVWIAIDYLDEAEAKASKLMTLCKEL